MTIVSLHYRDVSSMKNTYSRESNKAIFLIYFFLHTNACAIRKSRRTFVNCKSRAEHGKLIRVCHLKISYFAMSIIQCFFFFIPLLSIQNPFTLRVFVMCWCKSDKQYKIESEVLLFYLILQNVTYTNNSYTC